MGIQRIITVSESEKGHWNWDGMCREGLDAVACLRAQVLLGAS